VQKLRQTFPQAACLLIAPPDRGILVPASSRRRGAKAGHKTALPDLLRFARLHAQVGQAQHKVASEFGCKTWSMQTAMGGPGSAYAWARQKPSLMAPDLLHLSVPGYQKLGQQLARDWMAKP
jgi:lysophospholipase L1-like esterase